MDLKHLVLYEYYSPSMDIKNVDSLLDKIHEEGIKSLTQFELDFLTNYNQEDAIVKEIIHRLIDIDDLVPLIKDKINKTPVKERKHIVTNEWLPLAKEIDDLQDRLRMIYHLKPEHIQMYKSKMR